MDEIVVLSVNDCFVMRAWEKTFDTDKARGGRSTTRVCVCVYKCIRYIITYDTYITCNPNQNKP